MILRSVNRFALRDMAFSHGWIALSPWSWQPSPPALVRVERLPSGAIVRVAVTSPDPLAPTDEFHVALPRGLTSEDSQTVEQRLRWMLRLDEDFASFHALLSTLPGCEAPVARGEGRLLRSWDVFEDAVKTLCTTNTTWAQTKGMVVRLVARFGDPATLSAPCRSSDAVCMPAHPAAGSAASGRGLPGESMQTASALQAIAPSQGARPFPLLAFPEPERLAAATEAELRACGLGYRAEAVRRLAAAVAAGELPRHAWDWAALSGEELNARLTVLRGIGPYAAGNLRMLFGRYDRLAIDAWLRRAVQAAWFGGAAVPDREIEAAFARFGPWRALVYWFHPALHPGRDAWRASEIERGGE